MWPWPTDDDFSTMTGDIEPETWPAFAPQLPHGMIYNITISTPVFLFRLTETQVGVENLFQECL